eukprot:gene19433-26091_t
MGSGNAQRRLYKLHPQLHPQLPHVGSAITQQQVYELQPQRQVSHLQPHPQPHIPRAGSASTQRRVYQLHPQPQEYQLHPQLQEYQPQLQVSQLQPQLHESMPQPQPQPQDASLTDNSEARSHQPLGASRKRPVQTATKASHSARKMPKPALDSDREPLALIPAPALPRPAALSSEAVPLTPNQGKAQPHKKFALALSLAAAQLVDVGKAERQGDARLSMKMAVNRPILAATQQLGVGKAEKLSRVLMQGEARSNKRVALALSLFAAQRVNVGIVERQGDARPNRKMTVSPPIPGAAQQLGVGKAEKLSRVLKQGESRWNKKLALARSLAAAQQLGVGRAEKFSGALKQGEARSNKKLALAQSLAAAQRVHVGKVDRQGDARSNRKMTVSPPILAAAQQLGVGKAEKLSRALKQGEARSNKMGAGAVILATAQQPDVGNEEKLSKTLMQGDVRLVHQKVAVAPPIPAAWNQNQKRKQSAEMVHRLLPSCAFTVPACTTT